MIGSIILIATFQFYWLQKLYKDEEHTLQRTMDVVFRESMYKVQAERFKADSLTYKSSLGGDIFIGDIASFVQKSVTVNASGKQDSVSGLPANTITIVKRVPDSTLAHINMDSFVAAQIPHKQPSGMSLSIEQGSKDTVMSVQRGHSTHKTPGRFTTITNFLAGNRTLNDSIPIAKIDSAYKSALLKNGVTLAFTIAKDTLRKRDSTWAHRWQTAQVPVGFMGKNGYQATFDNPSFFLMKKISPQIFLSLLLLAFTAASFIFLYRMLLGLRQIAIMKNDLVSNITHELKTPIATVSVAIEALRNFGGIQNPERTKEYLDMSASELQRLGLLVDNVLRFSMFENREITLQKETFNLLQLTQEVMASMKLQFEKQQAHVSLETSGENFVIEADRLHITSVIYNLLDNALKYSKEDPHIIVRIIDHTEFIELQVSDDGIGIAPEYRDKIFEQFFRVPGDDRHTVKGYGLGLSYVAHILNRHQGFIEVKSEPGKGSTFSVKLPFKEAAVVNYGNGRKVIKKTIKLGRRQ